MSDLTSPELIEQFNKAAQLALEGKYEESLAEWDRLLGPSKEEREREGKKLVMSGLFLGVATMRKAWLLMDLDRIQEAKEVLESDIMQACLGQFDLENLYEYLFSYANVLGSLGDMKGMDDQMTRALCIAVDEFGDRDRAIKCWTNLMGHAIDNEDWEYLEKESANAQKFAINVKDEPFQIKAEWNHILALKELGRIEEARKEAKMLLDFFRDLGATDAADKVKELLKELKE